LQKEVYKVTVKFHTHGFFRYPTRRIKL